MTLSLKIFNKWVLWVFAQIRTSKLGSFPTCPLEIPLCLSVSLLSLIQTGSDQNDPCWVQSLWVTFCNAFIYYRLLYEECNGIEVLKRSVQSIQAVKIWESIWNYALSLGRFSWSNLVLWHIYQISPLMKASPNLILAEGYVWYKSHKMMSPLGEEHPYVSSSRWPLPSSSS